MKRGAAVGLALLLAMPGYAVVAHADELEEPVAEEIVEDGEAQDDIEFEKINKLTLDDALERALNENSSLMLLKYQLEIIENQEGGTSKDLRDLRFDIRDLERMRDRLRKLPTNTFQERYAIQQQLESLEDVIDALEEALEQIKSGKVTLSYTEEEARANIQMGTTATYMQLLMAKEERALKENVLKTKEREVNALKRRYELGLASYHDYQVELREIERLQTEIAQADKQWQQEMAAFALSLGIVYHPDLELEPVRLGTLELVTQEKETEELVKNLFKYKRQEEKIRLAEYMRDRVYSDDDSTTYEKNEADLQVKVEKETLEQIKLDAETAIQQLYYEVEKGYQDMLNAEREWRYAQDDMKALERRYALGVVSKLQYELAQVQLEQAKFAYEMAKQAYFLKTKQVELLELGVI